MGDCVFVEPGTFDQLPEAAEVGWALYCAGSKCEACRADALAPLTGNGTIVVLLAVACYLACVWHAASALDAMPPCCMR